MFTTEQKPLRRLRAVCAALLLMLGSIAVPASLVITELDVCSMACCVEQRRCCCSAGHAFVRQQPSDGRDEIAQAEISARCTEGCVTSQTFSRIFSRDAGEAVADSYYLSAPVRSHSAQAGAAHDSANLESSSPRAPPASKTYPTA
jgi:hypothetical protein